MLNALKNKPTSDDETGWNIVDCLRNSKGQGKFSPPTFAGTVRDENGVECPCDDLLHAEEDKCTKQALDYVFWLVPEEKSSPANEGLGEPQTSEEETINDTQRFEVAISETQVEEFPCSGLPVNYCSDHFGISTVIQPAQKRS